jgi:O-antigen/teichoic acid export membrane protein
MAASKFSLNVIANMGGQAWRALMSLIFVPFYVHILGVEAYGLIGLYTSVQLMLALLDAGLRPTLSREMARFTGGSMDALGIRTLLRSAECLIVVPVLIIIAGMLVAAPWLADYLVHAKTIRGPAVTHAFMIMGGVAAAQLIESMYASCLSGLQRQVLQNMIMSFVATLRGFGSLAVLYLTPTVTAYFIWQAVSSVVSLLLLMAAVYHTLPTPGGPVRFNLSSLRPIKNYALGMLSISLVSLLLTQSDKFVLARYMPLAEVGLYSIASSLASALSTLSSPIGVALYPRLAQLLELNDIPLMAQTFHRTARFTVILVGSASAMLVFFGQPLMTLWLHNPALAVQVSGILLLMALGGLAISLTALPYMVQLAYGWTSLTLKINIISLLVFLPGMIFAVRHFGALGAASSWVILNLVGLASSASLTFRKVLVGEQRTWWLKDVLAPLAIVYGCGALVRLLLPVSANAIVELGLLIGAGSLIITCGFLGDAEFRGRAFRLAGFA